MSTASGTAARTRATSSSRRAPIRGGVLLLALDRSLHRDGEGGDAGHVEGAGADVALLAAAVQQRRAGDVPAEQQGADADRAAQLVAGDGQRGGAAGGEVDRDLPDRLDGVGVERHAVPAASAASSATGWTVPTSLFAHMTVTRAISSPCAASSAASAAGWIRPSSSTGSQLTVGALVRGQPVHGVEHRVVLDRAGQHPGAPGVGRPRGPEDALDSQVVASVPPPVKMTSDGRAPRAAAMRSRASSTSRGHTGRRRAARRRCRPGARWP